MQKTNLFLFPTLVKVIDNFLDDEELKELKDKCEKVNKKYTRSFDGDGKTSHNIVDDLVTSKKINNELNDYVKEYGGVFYSDDYQSWSNVQNKGSSLNAHTHPNSTVSFVLYINVDGGVLTFRNPNSYVHYTTNKDPENSSEFLFTTYSFDCINKRMIIFPSWLEHWAYSDCDNRIVISGNKN
jgi:hypothetical protein